MLTTEPFGPNLRVINTQTHNAPTSLRRLWQETMGDRRRNIHADCGWPERVSNINPRDYRDLYDSDPIARRVVQLLPKERWQVLPEIYEDENSETQTPFEKSLTDLNSKLRGSGWYAGDGNSVICEYMKRLDVMSGIGTFGVMLFGLDDGKRLDEPVEGVVEQVHNGIAFDKNNRLVDTWMTENEEAKYTDLSPYEQETVKIWAKQRTMIANAVERVKERLPVRNEDDGSDNPYSPKSVLGAYQQDPNWFGVQFGAPEQLAEKPSKVKHELLFLRVFDESAVQVVRWEQSVQSPRFGHPVMYRITFNDPREQSAGSMTMPSTTAMVHWSRILHVAEDRGSIETTAASRMQPVYNQILDLRKVRGSGAEGYYQSAFPGLTFETHPALGGEVNLDMDAARDAVENYTNSLQRFLLGVGGAWKTLPPSVVDPTPHITMGIEAICIILGCPVRIFKGSERGELASSQDDSQWNDRIQESQNGYVTPNILVPFLDRLILYGVLEAPKQAGVQNTRRVTRMVSRWVFNADGTIVEEKTAQQTTLTEAVGGYKIEWPGLDSLGEKDKAGIAGTLTAALAAYAQSGAADLMPIKEYLSLVWKLPDNVVQSAVEAMEAHQEDVMAEQEAQQQEMLDQQQQQGGQQGQQGFGNAEDQNQTNRPDANGDGAETADAGAAPAFR